MRSTVPNCEKDDGWNHQGSSRSHLAKLSDRARGAAVRVMTAVTELQNSSVEEWENSVNEVLIMVMIQ